MEHLTNEQVGKINKVALAEKHNCSAAYVAQVLKGEKKANSQKAKDVLKDGLEIIAVLEGNPTEQTQTENA